MTGATVAFEELLDAFDDATFAQMGELGFTQFTFQYGFAKSAFQRLAHRPGVTGFSRALDLTPHIDEADLVVCPAGAGSILDVLRRPEPPRLVVCINKSLLGNHQVEIAHALAQSGHLVMCDPQTVAQGVADAANHRFKRLASPVSLQSVVDRELGAAFI